MNVGMCVGYVLYRNLREIVIYLKQWSGGMHACSPRQVLNFTASDTGSGGFFFPTLVGKRINFQYYDTIRRQFYVHDKFMRICQNGPLDKFVIFIYAF